MTVVVVIPIWLAVDIAMGLNGDRHGSPWRSPRASPWVSPWRRILTMVKLQ